jgi:pimeloyl-ACP methyl ester carboxylesterase
MHPIVVVHGAFGGGWEWVPVGARLRTEGFEVFTPTLAGLGERADAPAETITLATHVDDVVQAIESEDLRDVVLCAASYGGMPVTVAASHLSDRLAKLVYLDALVPRDGESAADLLPDWFTDLVHAGLAATGSDLRVPVPDVVLPPEGSAPEPVRSDYVARLVAHPALTFTEPARVAPHRVPTTFVRCIGSTLGEAGADPIDPMAQRAREHGWEVRELEATHDPHLSDPDAVVALLRELAG